MVPMLIQEVLDFLLEGLDSIATKVRVHLPALVTETTSQAYVIQANLAAIVWSCANKVTSKTAQRTNLQLDFMPLYLLLGLPVSLAQFSLGIFQLLLADIPELLQFVLNKTTCTQRMVPGGSQRTLTELIRGHWRLEAVRTAHPSSGGYPLKLHEAPVLLLLLKLGFEGLNLLRWVIGGWWWRRCRFALAALAFRLVSLTAQHCAEDRTKAKTTQGSFNLSLLGLIGSRGTLTLPPGAAGLGGIVKQLYASWQCDSGLKATPTGSTTCTGRETGLPNPVPEEIAARYLQRASCALLLALLQPQSDTSCSNQRAGRWVKRS